MIKEEVQKLLEGYKLGLKQKEAEYHMQVGAIQAVEAVLKLDEKEEQDAE